MLANRTCATPMQHLNICNLRTTVQRKNTWNLRTVVQRKNICNLRTVVQRKNMPSAHSHAEAERKHSPASRLLRILCEAQIFTVGADPTDFVQSADSDHHADPL